MYDMPPQAIQENRITPDRFFVINPENCPTKNSGELDIEFRLGSDVKNINIVADSGNFITLSGFLRSKDDRIPEDAKVSVHYHYANVGINGTYQQDGTFSIEGVENKPFTLAIQFAYSVDENGRPIEYMDEWIGFSPSQVGELFQNEKNGERTQLEIELDECGYLEGIVYDSNQNPVPFVWVRTDADLTKSKMDSTDQDGKFRISQLDKEKHYSLYIVPIEDGAIPVLSITDLLPNQDNVILKYDPLKE